MHMHSSVVLHCNSSRTHRSVPTVLGTCCNQLTICTLNRTELQQSWAAFPYKPTFRARLCSETAEQQPCSPDHLMSTCASLNITLMDIPGEQCLVPHMPVTHARHPWQAQWLAALSPRAKARHGAGHARTHGRVGTVPRCRVWP